MLQSRATLLAVFIAVTVFIINQIGGFDLFDRFIDFLRSLEKYQLDDIFLMLCIVLLGVVWDLYALQKKNRHHKELQDQKLQVLRATMVTVLDITNSLLASVRLFLYEVDAGKKASTAEIELLDASMKDAATRLKSLHERDSITDLELGESYTPGAPSSDSGGIG